MEDKKVTSLTENSNSLSIRPQSPRFHIVLDIDGTLATAFVDTTLQDLLAKFPDLYYWLHHNLYLEALFPHFLHPGAIEFIQWLLQNPNVKLSFFSSGTSERNDEFVKKLLARSSQMHYSYARNEVKVYSKNNLAEGGPHGKKDLSKIDPSSLDNVILIDDNPTFILEDQKRNALMTGISETDFCELLEGKRRDPNPYDHLERSLLLNLNINHLFYVTGILKEAFSIPTNCLVDNINGLIADSPISTYSLNLFYYNSGLAELKKINPNLSLYNENLLDDYVNSENRSSMGMRK